MIRFVFCLMCIRLRQHTHLKRNRNARVGFHAEVALGRVKNILGGGRDPTATRPDMWVCSKMRSKLDAVPQLQRIFFQNAEHGGRPATAATAYMFFIVRSRVDAVPQQLHTAYNTSSCGERWLPRHSSCSRFCVPVTKHYISVLCVRVTHFV